MNNKIKREPIMKHIPLENRSERSLRNWYMLVADHFLDAHQELQYPNILGDYLWNLIINYVYYLPFANENDNLYNKPAFEVTLEDLYQIMCDKLDVNILNTFYKIAQNKYIYKPELRNKFLKITGNNIEDIKQMCKLYNMDFNRIKLWIEFGLRLPYSYNRKLNEMLGGSQWKLNI